MKSAAAACLLASLATPGCFLQQKRTQVFTAPPAIVRTAPAQIDPIEIARELSAPPEIIEDLPLLSLNVELLNIEPVMPPAPASPRATIQPKPTAPKTVEPPPAAAPAPAPRPATIITADERRRMEDELKVRLEHVKKVLDSVEGKPLSTELSGLARNARAYLNEAEQERLKDLSMAVSLATRADVYATDLSARLPF